MTRNVQVSVCDDCRLFFVGAREGQLPQVMAMINTKHYTPMPAMLFTVSTQYLDYILLTLIQYVGIITHTSSLHYRAMPAMLFTVSTLGLDYIFFLHRPSM